MLRALAIVLCCGSLVAAEKWDGDLNVSAGPMRAGTTASATLAAIANGQARPGMIAGREAGFSLIPYRWNLFEGACRPLSAKRTGVDSFAIDLPKDLPTGWYLLVTTVADDEGRLPDVQSAANGGKLERLLDRVPVVVRGADAGGPFLRVHAERGRCVFSPGERIRLFASARGAKGVSGTATISLDGGTVLAAGPLNAAAGTEQVLAFDIEAAVTAGLPVGDHELVASLDGKALDCMRVRIVAAQRPAGGGRWAHTMPSGTSSGFDGNAVLPEKLGSGRFGGHVDTVLEPIHQANLWVNFFANSWPISGPDQVLPEAGAADLPPAAAEYRPSLTHAYFQKLMAEGVALGVFMGYGEDYKAETYMPLPTVDGRQQAVLARKYLAGALGAATLPNFVAAYTDAYGHMDWAGGGELSAAQLAATRETNWREAAKAAGISVTQKPIALSFDWDDWSPEAREALKKKDGKTREAFEAVWKAKQAEAGGGKDWLEDACPTEKDQLALWQACFAAAGIRPAPEPPRREPLPTLDTGTTATVGRDAAYRYASFVLRGVERCYGAITRTVESELPAVFTIHNLGTMNHSVAPHAWTGFRTPNIDPAYLADGASAISVSEWNLDGVPKPYFLPTFYTQSLVDRGIPVYQCGLWKQMGSPARFMRDTVFWMGRGIQTYFDQTENMTWSHIGADQTTYASNERLAAVAGFHAAYSDVVPRLEPVREIGLYVPPIGGPWGHATTRGSYVAMLAGLMSGWQVHMVSHGDLGKPEGLGRYPVIFAPSIAPDSLYPFEEKAFAAYTAAGGKVVASQAPDYYHKPEVYGRYGISSRQEQVLDEQGQPVLKKDGSPRLTTLWSATPEQWAKLTRETTWGFLQAGASAAPIDVNQQYTHLGADGKPATWEGSHWTGHHEWARFRGPALAQFPALAKAFAAVREPIVRKDMAEVFVDVTKPKGGGAGWWVFASNWTLPDEADLYTQRVPQGFFNSSVKPVRAHLALQLPGAGAVYDVLSAKRIETRVEDGRLAFDADFANVEGRVFVVLPEPIAGAALTAPASVAAGAPIAARFALRNAAGTAMGILGAVRVELLGPDGARLVSLDRALPVDGTLPLLNAPLGMQRLTFRVTDLIAGYVAESTIAVAAPAITAARPAGAVTVHRGDRINAVLRSTGLMVAWDAGAFSFKDGKRTLATPNAQAARDRAWAERVAKALQTAGITASVAGTDQLVSGRLTAHPWEGAMAGYRQNATVPDIAIAQPVLLVGDPATSPVLAGMERAWVAGRSLGRDNTGAGRATIAFQARAFDPLVDAAVLAASDDAGLAAAIAELTAIAKSPPPADATYAAREAVRFAWLPAEVELAKHRNLPAAPVASGTETAAKLGWPGLAGSLGQAVIAIDAGPAGVVVGTKSWSTPTVLLSADGQVRGAWGGGAEVAPRDVGISADGSTAWAGYSLMGRLAAYQPGKGAITVKPTPVVHKDNPFEWDSFKDSDRHLGVSPDKSVAIAPIDGALVGFDPVTGKERWRIAGAVSPEAPRGMPMPEVGFSADGKLALIAPLVVDGERTVRYTVKRRMWDAAGKRYDRSKSDDVEVTAKVKLLRRDLRLVDAASGATRWTRTTEVSLVDAATGDVVWAPGRAPQQTVTDAATDRKPHTWKGADDAVPLDTATGKPVAMPAILDIGLWHLYSAVGPGGAWCAAGTRDAMFALFDDTGKLLRRFEPRDLPSELDPGSMIPPTLLPSRDAERVLLFAPQARTAFLSRIMVGSAAVRATARQLADANRDLVGRIRAAVGDRKRFASFSDKTWMAAFAQEIAAVPEDLRRELTGQMGRIESEAKAGRKRGPEWFDGNVAKIDRRLYEEDKAALDAAVALRIERRIELPAIISDLKGDAKLETLYVGLWDGSVRALRSADGTELWRCAVTGGSRLAVVTDPAGPVTALYAGGSRGSLTRIDPTSGKVLWSLQLP
jgi:hypothetical protein